MRCFLKIKCCCEKPDLEQNLLFSTKTLDFSVNFSVFSAVSEKTGYQFVNLCTEKSTVFERFKIHVAFFVVSAYHRTRTY